MLDLNTLEMETIDAPDLHLDVKQVKRYDNFLMTLSGSNTLCKMTNAFEKVSTLDLNLQDSQEILRFDFSHDKKFLMIETEKAAVVFDD